MADFPDSDPLDVKGLQACKHCRQHCQGFSIAGFIVQRLTIGIGHNSLKHLGKVGLLRPRLFARPGNRQLVLELKKLLKKIGGKHAVLIGGGGAHNDAVVDETALQR